MNIAKRVKVFGPAFFKKLAVGKAEPYGLALAAQPGGKNQGRCPTRPEARKQGPGRFSPSFPERAAKTGRTLAYALRAVRPAVLHSFPAKLRFAFGRGALPHTPQPLKRLAKLLRRFAVVFF